MFEMALTQFRYNLTEYKELKQAIVRTGLPDEDYDIHELESTLLRDDNTKVGNGG